MQNLKDKKLYLCVYDEIKRYISQKNLKPGDKLPTEIELTESLGVSRNVLREALKALEITGVVSSKPGVGMVLNEFNAKFLSSNLFIDIIGEGTKLIEDSHEVRKILEIGFANHCFDSITNEQINELEKILEKMEQTEDPSDFYHLDNQFHHVMYEQVGNAVLTAFIDSAWACEQNYRTQWVHNKKLTVKKHRLIYETLKIHRYVDFMQALHFHYEYKFKEKLPNIEDVYNDATD